MIDSHAHVAFPQFDADREAVISRAQRAGVTGWIEVGTDVAQSKKAIETARRYPAARATVGVHPSDVAQLSESAWTELEGLLTSDTVVAVGEVGLDYYRGGMREQQLPSLIRFVRLAVQRDLPVVFHVRDAAGSSVSADGSSAHEDLLAYLEELPDQERPAGVLHTFSGSSRQAERYLTLGLYLSFSGVVTFKNAGEIAQVAATMPLNRCLIETDCPFLAPEPYRGKRNEPACVSLVAEKIAQLRGMAAADIDHATTENTRRLFKIAPSYEAAGRREHF
jgi:TatD DNase family protein